MIPVNTLYDLKLSGSHEAVVRLMHHKYFNYEKLQTTIKQKHMQNDSFIKRKSINAKRMKLPKLVTQVQN